MYDLLAQKREKNVASKVKVSLFPGEYFCLIAHKAKVCIKHSAVFIQGWGLFQLTVKHWGQKGAIMRQIIIFFTLFNLLFDLIFLFEVIIPNRAIP